MKKRVFSMLLALSITLALCISSATAAYVISNISSIPNNSSDSTFVDEDLAPEEREDPVTGGIISSGLHNFMRVNTYKEDQYSDVPATHTFSENAKAAYEFDIMKGYGSSFGVSDNITRLASIIIACRLNCIYYGGSNYIEEGYSGTTTEKYMTYAKDFGILCDFDDISKPATRAEFAAILSSAFPDEALNVVNIVDDNAVPDVSMDMVYSEEIYRLYRAGILNGSDSEGTFHPNSYITRGAACAIATRMCNESLRKAVLLIDKEKVESNLETTYIVDMGIGKFHYSSCEEASKISNEDVAQHTGNRVFLISFGFMPCQVCCS